MFVSTQKCTFNKTHMGDLNVRGMTTFKWNLKKQGIGICQDQHRIPSPAFMTTILNLMCVQTAEDLLAVRLFGFEVLHSMELKY